MRIVAIFGIQYDINNLKTNLTSFYISLTGDTVKFLFRFKWLVKRGLGRPLFLFIPVTQTRRPAPAITMILMIILWN
jgi:hypothetical protein